MQHVVMDSLHCWINPALGTSINFAKVTQEGLQRLLAKPVIKKELITVETLEAIVQDAEGSGTLADLCLETACL